MEKIRHKRFFGTNVGQLSRSRAGSVVMFLFLLVFAAFSALPILLIFMQSVKPLNELFVYPPKFYVVSPTLNNFRQLGSIMSDSMVPLSRYVFNSALVSVVGTVGHILLASMCAYPLAKVRLKGGNVIFTLIVTSLMFASTVSDIVNYQTISSLHLLDTYAAIILPALGSSLGLYIMKQFMEQLPDSIIESAEIDGAGRPMTFWRVVMPNVKPAWLTLAIFSFQGLWNSTNSTYIYSEQYKSLPYALNQIAAGGVMRTGVASAVSVIVLVVPLLLFILTQSRIVETMATSGMKE